MKKVIIVSPHFPPSTLAGVHRARLVSRYLRNYGWEPTVFCVDERYHEEKLDYELAKLVPDYVEIVKVPAVSSKLARPLGIGDISLRGYYQLKNAISNHIRTRGTDVLFVTMAPYYSSIIGSSLASKYGIPLVLDYQDPWLSRYGATAPVLSKLWFSHKLSELLEPRVVRWASHITSVSTGTNEEILKRYSYLNEDDFSAMPIGGDPEDYTFLRNNSIECHHVQLNPDTFNFCYIGTIWPKVLDTLRAFVMAVKRLKERDAAVYDKVHFYFVGTSGQPNVKNDYRILPLASELGVREKFTEVPQRIPYLEALSVMANARVNLLLGSNETHYTASKLYPALLAARPLLVICHEESSVVEISAETGGVRIVPFSTDQGVFTRTEQMVDAFVESVTGRYSYPPLVLDALKPYMADHIAGQFAQVFENVLSHPVRIPRD